MASGNGGSKKSSAMSSRIREARREPPADRRSEDAGVSESRSDPIIKRKRGRDASQAPGYSVSTDIAENLPITEAELRALEILLGGDLKKLFADTASESLKFSRLDR